MVVELWQVGWVGFWEIGILLGSKIEGILFLLLFGLVGVRMLWVVGEGGGGISVWGQGGRYLGVWRGGGDDEGFVCEGLVVVVELGVGLNE